MGSYNVANGLNVKGEQQWAQYGSLRHTPDLSIGELIDTLFNMIYGFRKRLFSESEVTI